MESNLESMQINTEPQDHAILQNLPFLEPLLVFHAIFRGAQV